MRKILGYRKFNSKKGTPVCVVSYQEDFSDYDKEHSEELGGSKSPAQWCLVMTERFSTRIVSARSFRAS